MPTKLCCWALMWTVRRHPHRRPQTEAVVMLAGEDHSPHTGRRERLHNGIRVEPGGLKNIGILVAVAPFLAGKGVHREMQEGGGFEIVPAQLAPGGECSVGRGHG